VYHATRFGWCDPHDPSRETRSGREYPENEKPKSFWSKFFG
jgi:hypothetical protein